MDFSCDGKRLLTASWDRTARIWDIEKGQEIGRLDGQTSSVQYSQFSLDGKRALTISNDATARVWDISRTAAFVSNRAVMMAACLARGIGLRTPKERADLLLRDAPADMFADAMHQLEGRHPEVEAMTFAFHSAQHADRYLTPTQLAEKYELPEASPRDEGEAAVYCSFCGKSQHEVRKLVAGPKVFICDECIQLCTEVISDRPPPARSDLPVIDDS